MRVIVKNPGEAINSEYDDYYAIPDKNDSVLFYTSRRPLDEKSKRSKYDNKYFENIHKTKRRDNDWDKGVVLDKPLNSRGNEAALDLSMDGRRLYIYNGDKNRGDFYKAEFKKGKWRKPKSLSSRFNSRYQETSLDASEGDSLIFFVSGNEKDSRGGKDIYYATLKINGRYNKPVNLGSVINTRYNEEGVFYDADNKTLYFSSKGHNTMGGYDVFKSKRDENGNWSEPVNLGYPANTPDDDLFFRISPVNPKYAYYTANREGTLGRRDIFQLIFLGEEKEMLMSLDDELIAYFNQPVPSIFFEKPEQIEIDTSLVLKGMIYDTISNEPVVAKLELIDIERSMTVATAVSNENGQYKIKIKQKKEYGVEIMARGYLFFLETIDLSRLPGEIVIERDFGLTKVEVGSKVILKNIFFETNKATLKPESYQELQNVVKFLDNNPSIHLEISGHTDNIGSLKANMKLSEERAKSVVEYLVAQKISRNRLEAKGYAFTQPVAPNNTPEGRAQNRRVEFKVISK
ncbi:MAG: OmpA family protein [Bacteroidota bacterium]